MNKLFKMQRFPRIKHFSTLLLRNSQKTLKLSERKILTTRAKFQSKKLVYSEENSAERSLYSALTMHPLCLIMNCANRVWAKLCIQVINHQSTNNTLLIEKVSYIYV